MFIIVAQKKSIVWIVYDSNTGTTFGTDCKQTADSTAKALGEKFEAKYTVHQIESFSETLSQLN